MLRAAVLALTVAFLPEGFAQERARVGEDTLIKDPEVAAPGKWKVGGALEYWYVREETTPPQGSATSHVTSNQVGANAFAGYDNFTLQYTHRSGDEHLDTSADISGGPFITSQEVKRDSDEMTLRWLARDWSTSLVTPYFLAGYAWGDSKADINVTTGQRNACTGTASYSREFKFTAPFLGIGGIFPFTDAMGARVDGRYKRYQTTTQMLGACPGLSRDGNGTDLTATGYYIITPAWNVQLGVKYQTVPGAALQNAPGVTVEGNNSKRFGVFGMLGYTHEF
jgi:hypothetical protein